MDDVVADQVELYRLARWRGWNTVGVPLLWSMHLSYLCLPLAMAGLGLAGDDPVANRNVMHLLAIGTVLGVIGWLNIPLDMMTITIAAISMGIAVDNTIHYIYRFRQEFDAERDYAKTMFRCHTSIGFAIYYTSVTIIIGFSILALSNFLPTIYFGLLTGLAMLIALIGSLTLLPQLLIVFKPFGPEVKGKT